MKKILIVGTVLAAIPFVSFAQTTAATNTQVNVAANTSATVVAPGLLPGDFFYFLDKLTEAFNTALTFNKEKKARLHLEYAKERVAEIKEVLKDSKAKIDDIAGAKADFVAEIAAAAAIVKEEKDNGSDVKDMAKELDDELDDARNELKDTLKDHRDGYSRAELELRAKIATLAPSDPQVAGLTQALLSIKKEKEDSGKEEADVDVELMDDQNIFDDAMSTDVSARKHMDELLKLRAEMGLVASGNAMVSTDKLIKDAQAAANRGDYQLAKKLFKQAEHVIEKAGENNKEKDGGNNDVSADTEGGHGNNLDLEIKAGVRNNMEDSLSL